MAKVWSVSGTPENGITIWASTAMTATISAVFVRFLSFADLIGHPFGFFCFIIAQESPLDKRQLRERVVTLVKNCEEACEALVTIGFACYNEVTKKKTKEDMTMPYPKDKDLQVKLNENDIQKIMTWYWIAVEEQVDADGQPLTAQAKEKNAKTLEELLPKVPAIYMDLIQNAVLDNWKPYNELEVDKPEHPAFHLETSSRFYEDTEHEHEIGSRNPVTGDYNIDKFMRMRSTGKHAAELFGGLSRGGYGLNDLDRAREYCRENGYEMEMLMDESGDLEAEIAAAAREALLNEEIAQGESLADDIARAAAERERIEALEAGIEEGDAIMAEAEAEMKAPRNLSQRLADALDGKTALATGTTKGEFASVKTAKEITGKDFQKKIVDWQGQFENVPTATRKQELIGLEITASSFGVKLDDPTAEK